MDSDTMYTALRLVGIITIAYILVLWIAATLWAHRDIISRTTDKGTQAGMTALVALGNVPGLLLYLALRPPELLTEQYNRQLEAEAFLREIRQENACPECNRAITDDFVACPYCAATLQTACPECGRNLKTAWVMCPFCTADRGGRTAATERRMPAFSPRSMPAPVRAMATPANLRREPKPGTPASRPIA